MIQAYTNEDYAKAYTELLHILTYISKEDFSKIPKEHIAFFEQHKALNHSYTYSFEKPFEEQNISKLTKILIAYLYQTYWATEEEKEWIKRQEYAEFIKLEEEKRKRYNPDDLFKTTNKTAENRLVIVKPKNIWIRILEKIKEKLQK